MKKMNHVYVYGTLRPSYKGSEVGETFQVPGVLYDLGWYPGIKLLAPDAKTFVTCERLSVTDDELSNLDRYEGYRPESPDTSLFLRVPYLDGFIYIYNHSFDDREVIASGDFVEYMKNKQNSPRLWAEAVEQEEEGVA